MFTQNSFFNRMWPEVKCLYLISSRHELCRLSVSNKTDHKFSHSAASCMLNGKSINVMLEFHFFVLSVKTDMGSSYWETRELWLLI